MGPRRPVEKPSEGFPHRAAALARDRIDGVIARRQAQRDALQADLDATRARLSARLGRLIPEDPGGLLYDVLERVERMDDGGWRWLGSTNNHGSPTVKISGHEWTVRRFLAVAFDVIPADFPGAVYRDSAAMRCGYLDVNPFRMVPREHAGGKPRGNPRRFDGTPATDAVTSGP